MAINEKCASSTEAIAYKLKSVSWKQAHGNRIRLLSNIEMENGN